METTTSKDGTRIGWRVAGSGPPLLLVHGTTADHSRWNQISPRLESRFTVCAMDRRGRGASGDAESYHVLREAEDVAAVVDAIGEDVAVVAHSYGAVCGLEAMRLTTNIERLVLYEPPIPTGLPMYPPGVPHRIQALVDSGEFEAAVELFFREVVRMPDDQFARYRELPAWPSRVALAPTIARELAIDLDYTFAGAEFYEIDVPTLLMLGADSPPLFQNAIGVVDAALSSATVVELPGQQHIAMDLDPELFLREVLAFLTSA